MKRFIVCLITLSLATCMWGMEEDREEALFLQMPEVKGRMRQVGEELFAAFSPRYKRDQEDRRSLALQQSLMAKHYPLLTVKGRPRELSLSIDQAISRKPLVSLSYVLQVTNNIKAAIWSILRAVLIAPSDIFFGKQQDFEAHPYVYERSPNSLKDEANIQSAKVLFTAQAKETAAASNFQVKNAVAWSALLAAVGTGIVSQKCGYNSTAMQIGSCIGIAAGVLSWVASGASARICDVNKRQQARILGLSAIPLSSQEADAAYTEAIGGGFFSGIRLYGPFGLLAARTMRNTVRSNFALTTRLTEVPVV